GWKVRGSAPDTVTPDFHQEGQKSFCAEDSGPLGCAHMALRAQASQEVFVGTDDADELTGALSDFFRVPVTPREFVLPGRTRIAVDFADGGDPPRVVFPRSRLRGELHAAHSNKAPAGP